MSYRDISSNNKRSHFVQHLWIAQYFHNLMFPDVITSIDSDTGTEPLLLFMHWVQISDCLCKEVLKITIRAATL